MKPTVREYKAKITISASDERRLQSILDKGAYLDGVKNGDTIETFTAKFQDGFEADVKVCNGNPPYVDAVLFDEHGNEMMFLEVSETLLGEYDFSVPTDGGNAVANYRVLVEKG